MPERDRIVFATFYPPSRNNDLVKDVGMIPYILHRDFGYDSYLFCYKRGDYPFLKTEVSGLRVLFMRGGRRKLLERLNTIRKKRPRLIRMLKLFYIILDAIRVLFRYGKQIDVFQLFHPNLESIIVGFIYKLINKNGILYLKLDANPDDFFNLCEEDHSVKRKHKTLLKYSLFLTLKLISLVSFDILSVESRHLYEFIMLNPHSFKKFIDHLYYIPNGLDVDRLTPLIKDFDEKENIILNVGSIGTYQKGSEVILEAFAKVARDFPSWKLIFIGVMHYPFTEYFKKFLEKNRTIQDRIAYLGFFTHKERLYNYYNRAKILAFPSRFESFGFAAIEAGIFGDVILGSDLPSFRDITSNGNFGYLCPVDNVKCFTETLRYMLSHDDELMKKSNSIKEFIRDNFNWNRICGSLHEIILTRKTNKCTQ